MLDADGHGRGRLYGQHAPRSGPCGGGRQCDGSDRRPGYRRDGDHHQDDPRDDACARAGYPGVRAGGPLENRGGRKEKSKITIPWFAFGFIAVIGLNSLLQYLTGAESVRDIPLNGAIEYVDTFMLTMAMTALGTETSIDKFRQAGAKPFVLAGLLYVWLSWAVIS